MNWPDDDDPIVAEVRRIREEYAAKFGYDMKLIDEDTKRRARESRARFELEEKNEHRQQHELAE